MEKYSKIAFQISEVRDIIFSYCSLEELKAMRLVNRMFIEKPIAVRNQRVYACNDRICEAFILYNLSARRRPNFDRFLAALIEEELPEDMKGTMTKKGIHRMKRLVKKDFEYKQF